MARELDDNLLAVEFTDTSDHAPADALAEASAWLRGFLDDPVGVVALNLLYHEGEYRLQMVATMEPSE